MRLTESLEVLFSPLLILLILFILSKKRNCTQLKVETTNNTNSTNSMAIKENDFADLF